MNGIVWNEKMGTRLIDSRKRGSKLKKLTDQQRVFCWELAADDQFRMTEAARKAGYSQPHSAAYKLLKKPEVQAFLGKVLSEREERCNLKADDVLEYLRFGLFFNPLKYFRPSEDGGWLITDPDALPEEVGRLIDEMELKVTEDKDGNKRTYFKVKLISKSQLLPLAMKHLGLLTEKMELTAKAKVDWDRLYGEENEPDALEQRLAYEEGVVDGNVEKPKE